MAMTEIGEAKPAEDHRSRWIGIWVGVLASLLAICSLGGGNATKDSTRANIDVTNTWAFFQAKNIRRTTFLIAADDLELIGAALPAAAPEARAAITKKVEAYRATAAQLKSEPKTGEGLDELFQRAKSIEQERDTALRKDPYFDIAQATLQIAIVLASVALIAGTDMLLWVSGALAAFGTAMMLNGFFLVFKLPLLG